MMITVLIMFVVFAVGLTITSQTNINDSDKIYESPFYIIFICVLFAVFLILIKL